MGFYQNAFNLMRHVYDECKRLNLTPNSPFQSAQDAFQPLTLTSMMENVSGVWKHWDILWPILRENANDPSSPIDFPGKEELFTNRLHPPRPWEYGKLLVKTGINFLEEALAQYTLLEHLVKDFAEHLPPISGSAPRAEHPTQLHRALAAIPDNRPPSQGERALIVDLLDGFGGVLHLAYIALRHINGSDELRRTVTVIDTAVYMAKGLYRDVIGKGYGAIEQFDFADWLREVGCHYPDSTLIRGFYDACFGYRDGNSSTPNMAAGSTLYGCLRLMLDYNGAIMWWMRAGMGDTIAAPIYLLLKERGVKFEFFHKITALHVEGGTVDSINIDVQATPKSGEYDPVFDVKGLPCWPSEALYEQLNEGSAIQQGKFNLESWWTGWKPVAQKRLQKGQDFDLVILGLSIGAFPYVCSELMEKDASGKWANMVRNVETTKTQALQLWMNKPMAQTWDVATSPCLCSYVEPYDTWADMSHLIERENWPANAVHQIAYFCDAYPNGSAAPPFTDTSYPASEQRAAVDLAKRFVNENLATLWPGTRMSDGGFDYNVLVAGQGQTGEQRFDSQFVRVNIDPTELYVLTINGSTEFRLLPGDSQFSNLFLAGDWTLTDPNIGCVEATVVSGRLCSQAICGLPAHIYEAMDDFSGQETAGVLRAGNAPT
jgi:uncharacterized protein with NAD-binding domain and iron-sulfur cluster